MRNRISIDDLRRIVSEELSLAVEQVDHETIKDITSSASKLLAAIESFKEDAPATQSAAVQEHLAPLEKILELMMTTPSAYVPALKPKVKKRKVVKLRPMAG